VAALDGDWSDAEPAERAAYVFARKLTYEPHRLTDADVADLRKHYTDLQILEMILSVAGNNAINRWKEGAGIPQSQDGSNFARRAERPLPTNRPLPIETYLTPTSKKYATMVTRVAPLLCDEQTGRISPQTVCIRPDLEPRAEVEKALAASRERTPRLPLVNEAKARELLSKDWPAGPLPQWVRLLANFPVQGMSRIVSQCSAEEQGDLPPLLKAQLSWIIARQDRAWYAVGEAKQRLRELGQSEEQIYALDGDWNEFTPTERAVFTVARKLAASPIVLTDADMAEAVKLAGPREVVQLIDYVTVRASFGRITEAAGLQLEK
jgi:alkylhydroperoxidase family enzyme